MAKAELNEVVTRTVTLTLSEDEAHTLVAIGAKIGGDPENSARGHFDAIYKELLFVLSLKDYDDSKFFSHLSNRSEIMFLDENGE